MPLVDIQLTQNHAVTVFCNYEGTMAEWCARINNHDTPLRKFRRHTAAEHL